MAELLIWQTVPLCIHLNTVLPYMGENSLIENEATRPAGKRGD